MPVFRIIRPNPVNLIISRIQSVELKEKLLAAKQAGIQKVVVPKENKPDVEELEEEITEGMQIVFAGSISDVLKEALVQK